MQTQKYYNQNNIGSKVTVRFLDIKDRGAKLIKVSIRDGEQTRLSIAKEGYNLKGFANSVGISHTYMSQILNGTRNPSPVIAKKIADGLNKKIESIFFVGIGNNATVDIKTK